MRERQVRIQASSVWAATSLLREVGVRDAVNVLGPLVRSNVENVIARGPAKAITGPIVRGDTQTIRRHIDALASAEPEVLEAYRALAKLTAHLVGVEDEIGGAL